MVQWACERAHLDIEGLMARFPKLPQWERGEVLPTFKQLTAFLAGSENLLESSSFPAFQNLPWRPWRPERSERFPCGIRLRHSIPAHSFAKVTYGLEFNFDPVAHRDNGRDCRSPWSGSPADCLPVELFPFWKQLLPGLPPGCPMNAKRLLGAWRPSSFSGQSCDRRR